MEHTVRRVNTTDGVSWHVEQFLPRTSKPDHEHVILVPSGEGDCHNLTSLAGILAERYGYSVVTFDMPGFSRTTAPPEAYEVVSAHIMASQIQRLLAHLGIKRTSAFGCSSGGLAVIGLAALEPGILDCAIIHEVPLEIYEPLVAMKQQTDQEIQEQCVAWFSKVLIEDTDAWSALGKDYHDRLSKNYIIFIRHYANQVEAHGRELATKDNLTKVPLFWTIGALNEGVEQEGGLYRLNFELAREAGLKVDTTTLKCLHFPSITVCEETAAWIDRCIQKAKGP